MIHRLALMALPMVIALATAAHAQIKDIDMRETSLPHVHFRIEIDGVAAGQFTAVEGLGTAVEVIEYQNGDDPLTRKRPGRVRYGDITLRRSYVNDPMMSDWIARSRDGRGRSHVTLTLVSDGAPVKQWNLGEAWVRSWNFSSLDGKGNDVLTEEVVVVIEWLEEGGA